MKNLSKEKKQHLLLVVIGTVGALSALWFGLISWQQTRITQIVAERDATRIKLETMTDTIKRSGSILTELDAEIKRLKVAESQMASGDVYEWLITTVRTFKVDHPVEIPQFSTVVISDTTLLPDFPYQQATLTVAGTAYYHDLGRFIANFENKFSYIRIQNLELKPGPGFEGGSSEILAFTMDIVALVKTEV